MSWFDQNRDLIGIGLAAIAIILSMYTALISRRQQRLDAFLRIQEQMFHTEMRRGRRRVYQFVVTGTLPAVDSPEFGQSIRALGLFDMLAMYVRRGIVPRDWVLDCWHRRLVELRPGYEQMIELRQHWHPTWQPWSDLKDLMNWADRYRCTRACCVPDVQMGSAVSVPRVRGRVEATKHSGGEEPGPED